ncbi:Pantothenate precursors transporter PanS [Thalassocella blandensis]|nr:Pantothenate precursors transporter PanS [Thalassocella blandensis]
MGQGMEFSVIYLVISSAIFMVMLVVGLSQQKEGYIFVQKHSRIFIIGLSMQLIGLPSAAYIICKIFDIPDIFATGLILMSLSPCGASCSAMCLFMGARTELSLCLTSFTSLFAFITIPIGTHILLGDSLPLQASDIVRQLVFVLVVPICLGAAIRRFFPEIIVKLLPRLRPYALLLLIVIFIFILFDNLAELIQAFEVLFLPCLALSVSAFILPRYFAELLGTDKLSAKTIGVQVGMQNGATALAVIITSPALTLSAISVAYYSVFAFLISFLLIYFWGEKSKPRVLESRN